MASISPIFNDKGNITHFIGVKEDISERKRIESELRESEHRYHSVVDQAQEGIMLLDEEGHVLTWNRALQKITDIADKDVLGKFIWDIQYSC